VRLQHFEALAPICPVCRVAGREASRLAIHRRITGDGDRIDEGALVCGAAICQSEFPILDGIPFIAADVSRVITVQHAALDRRRDLSDYSRSLIGDAVGPESVYERDRYQISSYGRSHYGDLDPERPLEPERALISIVGAALEATGAAGTGGVWLDLGCSTGRASFELAEATGGLVVGVDLNLAMLQVAAGALRGRVDHPLRRVGLVYDRRDFAVDFAAADRVDFWACDVMALPLADGQITGVLSLNVLDCVSSPLAHLRELGRVLRAGGLAAIASPFDWSTAVTPLEAWLGGHTGRAEHRGSSERELARLLAPADPANAQTRLVIDGEPLELEWEVYIHERASMRYRVHLVSAVRAA
jgi:SAM-dependent methyltransferase